MPQKIKATYREGAFFPQIPCNLPENSELELIILKTEQQSVDVIDPEARKQILHSLLNRMRQTSLVAHSRRLAAE